MKKLISVLLAVLMVVSLFSGVAVSFAAESEPIMYWSFENTTIDELKESTDNAFYTGGTVSIVSGGYNGSGHALKIQNADSGNGQWLNGLKSGTEYTVTFWAKMENRASTAWPNFGVDSYNGSEYVKEQNFTESWAKYSLSFKTASDSTQAKVYTWVFGSGNVDFYIDEVVVTEKQSTPIIPPDPSDNLISGWDFEDGNLNGLQSDSAYYQSGNVSVVPGGANGTSYALLVKNANSGNGQWINDLKPSTSYTVTFWVKLANRAEGSWPNVGVSDYDGSAYMAEQNFTESWAQYSLTFKTGADSTRAKFYTWVFGEGNVDFYVDEVVLTEQQTIPTPPSGEPLTGWDFEAGNLSGLQEDPAYYQSGNVSVVSGGANGTNYALLVKNANSGNGQWINDLKPNTNYTVTFWVKLANRAEGSWPNVGVSDYDGSAYIAEQNFTEEWAQYSLSFKTGADSTRAKFYTWIFGEGNVDFYVDEVTIAEKTAAPAPGTLEAWDFEAGNLAALGTPESGDEDGYYGSGVLSIVSGGAENTNYALKISGANSGNGQTITGLLPNTEYAITFWAKVLNNAGKAYPHVGIKNYDGTDAYLTQSRFTNAWSMYSLQFTTGPDSTSALFYTWIFGEGAVELYLDEVRIRAHSSDPFSDWDFEENNIWILGSPSNADGDGYYASGDLSIVLNDGGYCLKISNANSGNGKKVTGLKPATGYTIRFRAKVENSSGSAFPAVGVKNYYNTAFVRVPRETEPYRQINAFTSEWATYSLDFITGDNCASALFYTWIFGSGAIDLLLDDVTISENPALQRELLPEWDFESGSTAVLGSADGTDTDGYYASGNVSVISGGADSAYCLKISGADSGNGQFVTGLDRDADYVLKFRAKLASWGGAAYPNVGVNGYDGDNYAAINEFSSDWADYEIRFRTSDNAKEICVYTWIFGSGEAELLLDDVSLQRATDWMDEREEPAEYDYAFAVVGDPQILTNYYPEKLPAIFDWLTENKETRKISYVFSVGDSTHFDSDAEWERIMTQYGRLTDEIPYTVARGNHDSNAQFEKYLGDESYMDQFEGAYEDKPENTWRTFRAGAVDYLILSLDNGASDDVLAWAEDVISDHPDCSVIVTTHSYLAPDGTLNVGTSPTSVGSENDPIDIWETLISQYENISLVICGHESSEQIVLARQEGDAGNTVTVLMINGQETDAAQDYGPYGGAGLVALLCFSENGTHVEVVYYSTVREQYFMESNQFSFDLEHIHHYSSEVVNPTCTEGGYTVYTCDICGDSYTADETAALGHDYINHPAQAATCTAAGWKAYQTCSRCDYTTYEAIPALGHDYIDHEGKAATCTEGGWKAYQTCSRCDYTTYEAIPALGHDYIDHPAKAPTCTEPGYEAYQTCSRCDYTTYEEIPALGHLWNEGEVTIAPTATEDGLMSYTCTRPGCGATKTEIIPATGGQACAHAHTHEEHKDVTCTEAGYDRVVCNDCGATVSEVIHPALGHDYEDFASQDPTCTEVGWEAYHVCTRCGDTNYEEIPALGHDLIDHAAQAPTCTVNGWKAYQTCSRCDYTTYEEIAALGHDYVLSSIIDATCTESGSETHTCTRCGDSYSNEIEPLGHDFADFEGQAPTCTEKGWEAYQVCRRCDYSTYQELPRLGHNFKTTIVAPTCTEQGYTFYECTREGCGYTEKGGWTTALGHEWDDGKVTTPATATTTGIKTFTCTRCGATKTEVIPATGEKEPCDGGPNCPSYKFKDVKASDWYHEAVDFAVEQGLFKGMTETTFEPNTPMTRGMLVTVLWRYEGQPEGGANNFVDVKDSEWYAKAVAWAASKGIVTGVGNNKFDPNGKITREQMAAILFRYSGYKGFNTDKRDNFAGFPDKNKVSAWAKDAYGWAVAEKLIGGNVINGKTLLDPQGNATRAQVATILMRFIQNIVAANG